MGNFDLGIIRNRLEALEETIIFRLLDRVQFKLNLPVYESGAILDRMHKSNEEICAKFGRFDAVEEKPFFDLSKDEINLTPQIREKYLGFLKTACENGDDNEYGSTAEADISALQAISKRIHYGSVYVAESKFQENPEGFTEAVLAGDKNKVVEMLRNVKAEEKVLQRVFDKCEKIQSAYSSPFRKTIESEIVKEFYKNTIIPLTIEGELQYFFRRIEK